MKMAEKLAPWLAVQLEKLTVELKELKTVARLDHQMAARKDIQKVEK